MNMHTKYILLIFSLLLCGGVSSAQSGSELNGSGDIQTFPLPMPDANRLAIEKHQELLRASFRLNDSTQVAIKEKPTSTTEYGSSVTVQRRGKTSDVYQIYKMIAKGGTLRLVHAALVCLGSQKGILILEYEGGGVGAVEGFAMLRFSVDDIQFATLPLTEQGKIVFDRERPSEVEIWTSAPGSEHLSTASPKHYRIRRCIWQTRGFACKPIKGYVGPYAPGDIDDPGIEIK